MYKYLTNFSNSIENGNTQTLLRFNGDQNSTQDTEEAHRQNIIMPSGSLARSWVKKIM